MAPSPQGRLLSGKNRGLGQVILKALCTPTFTSDSNRGSKINIHSCLYLLLVTVYLTFSKRAPSACFPLLSPPRRLLPDLAFSLLQLISGWEGRYPPTRLARPWDTAHGYLVSTTRGHSSPRLAPSNPQRPGTDSHAGGYGWPHFPTPQLKLREVVTVTSSDTACKQGSRMRAAGGLPARWILTVGGISRPYGSGPPALGPAQVLFSGPCPADMP